MFIPTIMSQASDEQVRLVSLPPHLLQHYVCVAHMLTRSHAHTLRCSHAQMLTRSAGGWCCWRLPSPCRGTRIGRARGAFTLSPQEQAWRTSTCPAPARTRLPSHTHGACPSSVCGFAACGLVGVAEEGVVGPSKNRCHPGMLCTDRDGAWERCQR